MSWISRFRNRWRERDLAEEFDDELRFHLRRAHRGQPPPRPGAGRRRSRSQAAHGQHDDARRKTMREARVVTWLDGLGGDLRHGVRVLRRQPLLTVPRRADAVARHRRERRDLLGVRSRAPAAAAVRRARPARPADRRQPRRARRDQSDDPGTARGARGEPDARRRRVLRYARLPDRRRRRAAARHRRPRRSVAALDARRAP